MRLLVVASTVLLLSSCAGKSIGGDSVGKTINPNDIHEPVPRALKYSKYGNPAKYTVLGKTYYVKKSHIGYNQTGLGSWYGTKFHGRKTSTQETYNMYAMTAAHKTLPIPCYAEVTNLDNGKKIIVKINDRGPFHEGRIIDLSYAAAAKIGYLGKGTAHVRVKTIDIGRGSGNNYSNSPTAPTVENIEKTLGKGQFYYVQVGVYAQDKTVDAMVTRLAGARISPVSATMRSYNAKVRKVRVGPLKEMRIVKEVINRLEDAGIYPYKIITE